MSVPENPSQYPTPKYAWGLVILLTIAYISSYVDRYVVGLLVGPIKADLNINDFQMGLLISAFTAVYALAALPLGFVVDRKRRTLLVSFGIALWSIATVFTGLARSLWTFAVARMGVGVGEAVLSPSAFSMIGDSFPKERRGKPIGFYTAALVIGAGLANLIGAGVLSWVKSIGSVAMPLIGDVKPWQLVFIIVGLPGLLLAVIFLFVREPARVESSPREGARLWDAFVFIGPRVGVLLSFISIFAVMVSLAYSQSWLPETFTRTWGWPPEKYGLFNGIAILTISPWVVFLSGAWSDRWMKRGRKDAPLMIAIIGLLVMIPTAIIAPLFGNAYVAFGVLCITTAGISMVSATGVTALLNIVPGDIRGVVVAVYYMCISLVAAISPPLIGWFTDVIGEENLRYSMALYPAVVGIPIILLSPLTRKLYLRELAAYEANNA